MHLRRSHFASNPSIKSWSSFKISSAHSSADVVNGARTLSTSASERRLHHGTLCRCSSRRRYLRALSASASCENSPSKSVVYALLEIGPRGGSLKDFQ